MRKMACISSPLALAGAGSVDVGELDREIVYASTEDVVHAAPA